MMKIIKYQLMTEVNIGTEEEPNIVQTFTNKEIECPDTAFETMLAVAKSEAYNGEVIVEEGQPDPTVEPSAQEDTDAMLIDHEFRLTMLELGLTE